MKGSKPFSQLLPQSFLIKIHKKFLSQCFHTPENLSGKEIMTRGSLLTCNSLKMSTHKKIKTEWTNAELHKFLTAYFPHLSRSLWMGTQGFCRSLSAVINWIEKQGVFFFFFLHDVNIIYFAYYQNKKAPSFHPHINCQSLPIKVFE